MPTGYTAGVADGTITSLRQYAMLCARAFGATILMRDDPLTAEIPVFVPSDFHKTAMEREMVELERLRTVTREEAVRLAEAQYQDDLGSYNKFREEREAQRKRYEAMLEKARRFVPPSDDHANYATFLCTQLEESIRFDCEGYTSPPPEMIPAVDWLANRIADLGESIERHRKHYDEEVERTNSRNAWVQQLRDALDKMEE